MRYLINQWVVYHFLLLFLPVKSFTQAPSHDIDFIKEDLALALAQSEKRDRFIFIDAYTTWCGPCKLMDAEVFSDSSVASFFNAHFVNLKLDMEKGVGIEAAQQYGVSAYPTFLFLDSEGVLIHRGMGYHNPQEILALGQEAIDPSMQMASLAQTYQSGDRGGLQHFRYAQALYAAGDRRFDNIAQAYLDLQDNWSTPDHMDLVLKVAAKYGDPYYQYILDQRFLFIKAHGEGRVYGKLLSLLEKHFFEDIDHIKLSSTKKEFEDLFPASKEGKFYDAFEMKYYQRLGKKGLYLDKAKSYVKKYPNLTWVKLNEMAWDIYENHTDGKALKLATRWAKKSIDLLRTPYNTDTLAALFYKRGKQKPARKYAELAIELAKEAGTDYSVTTELLEKINKMEM